MNRVADDLSRQGWVTLPHDPALRDWVEDLVPLARAIASDPARRAAWLRHGETWFAGVNVLDNSPSGQIGQGSALPQSLMGTIADLGLPTTLDAGQLSVVYPGYPRRDVDESDAAYRFRKLRDAAHLDGLLPVGPARRRHLLEPHAYVLGIPLVDSDGSPLVLWPGSHKRVREAFYGALSGTAPERWADIDLTELYQETRRTIFSDCPRVELQAAPGEAYLVHRHTLHGVAPWSAGAFAPPEGRMIVYFRPAFADVAQWLFAD